MKTGLIIIIVILNIVLTIYIRQAKIKLNYSEEKEKATASEISLIEKNTLNHLLTKLVNYIKIHIYNEWG